MATQEWIIDAERLVVDSVGTVEDIVEATTIEFHDGLNPANSDCWGTLQVNLQLLKLRCETAIEQINLVRKA
jgi:hypothetical protein